MSKKKKPILSDYFLDEVRKEINHLYGNMEKERDITQENKRNR
ncbi:MULTISPECIES: hypothetical protein [Bacillus]|nr:MULTISPECIES: hypothetical protein [Bacillus]MED1409874.1 hypothetical protein [Bacillus paramycoides]MED1465044.1 hypothetical protein [Bacillus paramycoides]MED1493571.1 hypothetical protein [Bacillus paramycoides]